MTTPWLAVRAAEAARWQRQGGDRRPLRSLYAAAYSFLRFFHHRWEPGIPSAG